MRRTWSSTSSRRPRRRRGRPSSGSTPGPTGRARSPGEPLADELARRPIPIARWRHLPGHRGEAPERRSSPAGGRSCARRRALAAVTLADPASPAPPRTLSASLAPERPPGRALASTREGPGGAAPAPRPERELDDHASPIRTAEDVAARARPDEGRRDEGRPAPRLHPRGSARGGPAGAGHAAGRRSADGTEPGRAGRPGRARAPTPSSCSSTGRRCRRRRHPSARCTGRCCATAGWSPSRSSTPASATPSRPTWTTPRPSTGCSPRSP